jgi:hypothetical protein
VILEAIVAGTTYQLNGGGLTYRVATTGIGMPPIRRLRQRGPFQHGVSNRGFRLDERMINLVLFFQGASLADADARRDTLARIFQPMDDTPIALRWTREDGAVRQIDGYAEGLVDFPDTPGEDRIGVSQRVVVPFLCMGSDPVFYDPAVQTRFFSQVANGGWAVPLEVPLTAIAAAAINSVQELVYAGSWREYPVITVTGPLDGLTIENLATGEVLDFPELVLTTGQSMTIDLRYERKTVLRHDGTNLLPQLAEDSDLATWHLAPAPEAAGGLNNIRVTVGEDASYETSVLVTFYHRYLSL